MSTAYSLYDKDTDSLRKNCFRCPKQGSGNVTVAGREMKLQCRQFTQKGNALETMLSARQTDIFAADLIQIIDIGVDTAEWQMDKQFRFKAQSRGGGGLSKYDCEVDYQIPEMIKHQKLGYTEMLYVHYEDCPKKYIGTELQDMIYEQDSFEESYNTDNMLTDALQMSARNAVSEAIQYCDIIGIYGGSNERANMYDGILAQAYWAYTLNAYFHSLEFTINETEFVDGTYIHAKYAGLTINIGFDASQPSDATLNRYATRMEVYQAIVNWLNDEVKTESDRKYVDATFANNKIIVTSKWAENTVNLLMFVSALPTVSDWVSCDLYNGVSYKVVTVDGKNKLSKIK